MPHLSPMNWIIITFSSWSSLIILMSILWWHQLSPFSLPVAQFNKSSLTLFW